MCSHQQKACVLLLALVIPFLWVVRYKNGDIVLWLCLCFIQCTSAFVGAASPCSTCLWAVTKPPSHDKQKTPWCWLLIVFKPRARIWAGNFNPGNLTDWWCSTSYYCHFSQGLLHTSFLGLLPKERLRWKSLQKENHDKKHQQECFYYSLPSLHNLFISLFFT